MSYLFQSNAIPDSKSLKQLQKLVPANYKKSPILKLLQKFGTTQCTSFKINFKGFLLDRKIDAMAQFSTFVEQLTGESFCIYRVKDYANRVKSGVPMRITNLKPRNKYIPRRVGLV